MTRFIGHHHILREIVLVSNNANVEISGAFWTYNANDSIRFMKISRYGFRRDAYIILFGKTH
jgi:hypothetical protein